MVDKLEACPFCGGEASLTIPSEHVQADCADIYVSCDECEAEGQHFVVETQDRTPDLWPYEQRDAVAAWNQRTTPTEDARERVKVLEEALEPFTRTEVLEPNGVIVGLERYHFERARTALGNKETDRHG